MRPDAAIKPALSAERIQTYEQAMAHVGAGHAALDLYEWNAHVSAAFLLPLHVCEVVVRNTVADALMRQHGPQWPWVHGFRESLPSPASGYNPYREMRRVASGVCSSAADIIPALSFAFWQKMFTQRFDARLWSRRLRNRIAHHEPIFSRALANDLAAIQRVVAMRCAGTADWMQGHQAVTALLRERPR